jgi:hypothetical protein
MSLRERLAERLFGSVIEGRVKAAVKAIDDQWWRQVGGAAGPQDKHWWEIKDDLDNALDAWRTNPLAFRIVNLTTDYVVGASIQVTSPVSYVDRFVNQLWSHRLNKMSLRLYSWCDELTRAGDLFVAMFTNPADGLSYFRAINAVKIDKIETDPEDLERELRYHELRDDDPIQGKWWQGWENAKDDPTQPVMLHYAVNRPVGCIRGQSDLAALLPWLRRYREWLEDRVRVNRYKNAFLWHVKLQGASSGDIQSKQSQYAELPTPGSVIVTDENEEWAPVQPNIQAEDVKDDGRALRLMIAAGAGTPLHYLAESESATRAMATEMTGPTMRHYEHRQNFFRDLVLDVVEKAHHRAHVAGRINLPRAGLQLTTTVSDLREEDSLKVARAAKEIVNYLREMKALGYITDRKAMEMAFKFAGEVIDVEAMLKELHPTDLDAPIGGGADDGDSAPQDRHELQGDLSPRRHR